MRGAPAGSSATTSSGEGSCCGCWTGGGRVQHSPNAAGHWALGAGHLKQMGRAWRGAVPLGAGVGGRVRSAAAAAAAQTGACRRCACKPPCIVLQQRFARGKQASPSCGCTSTPARVTVAERRCVAPAATSSTAQLASSSIHSSFEDSPAIVGSNGRRGPPAACDGTAAKSRAVTRAATRRAMVSRSARGVSARISIEGARCRAQRHRRRRHRDLWHLHASRHTTWASHPFHAFARQQSSAFLPANNLRN